MDVEVDIDMDINIDTGIGCARGHVTQMDTTL